MKDSEPLFWAVAPAAFALVCAFAGCAPEDSEKTAAPAAENAAAVPVAEGADAGVPAQPDDSPRADPAIPAGTSGYVLPEKIAYADIGVSRETFDFGWKFAKFGKFDECLSANEPGTAGDNYSASGAESKNPITHAFDGAAETRWCANARGNAWLQVDFGRECDLASTKIIWESESNYRYKILGSKDGKNWTQLVDRSRKTEAAKENVEAFSDSESVRYVKIEISPTAPAWASICEWTFFSNSGAELKPETPAGTLTAGDPAFDDSAWRTLDLPHDWGIESAFLASEPNQTASLPWAAVGWYRKTFDVPAEKAGKKIFLDFDGVMMVPQVYVNGQMAGQWKYGYSSFRVDITPFLKYGEKNVVAVRAQNLPNSTRWYPGGGIYRHVWLVEKNPVHIAYNGVFATTPRITGIHKDAGTGKLFADKVKLSVSVEVEDNGAGHSGVSVKTDVVRGGNVLATLTGTDAAKNLENIELWDVENPALYTLVTEVSVEGKVVDRKETAFGFRKAEWEADGFYLNGRRVQLNGVCLHHDLGALGTAVHTRGIERQLEIVRSYGTNAIRTSHNPPAPELLDLCDRMGILVNAELFDCWKHLKEGKLNGYNLFWENWRELDVRNFVKRDRNHPCIIIWSAGNEIEEQHSADGVLLAKDLVERFKKYDPTRPITIGSNDIRASKSAFGKSFDVFGFNYKPNNYAEFAKNNPGTPFFGAETSSAISSRGFYSFPTGNDWTAFWAKNFCDNLAVCQVSDYGTAAVGWGSSPDVEFACQEDNPRSAGEFVWTGFDYLGEPTPWNLGRKPANDFRGASKEEIARLEKEFAEILKKGTPSRSSYFGIVDLAGFRKDRAWLYQSHWLPDVPVAHILPHWNWQGSREGKITPVFVYTSGDSAELFLNGKSLGKRTKKHKFPATDKNMNGDLRERFRLTWTDVVYEPGTLEVVAYKDGKEWARDKVETTGAPETFSVRADRSPIRGDGRDLAYVTVAVRDAQNRVVPTATTLFKFSVSGPAEIVGVCNGDPTDHASLKGSEMKAFAGLAQVIVRSKRGETGTAELSVDGGAEFGTKTLKIEVK